jgi:hypothetical protein
MGTTWNCARRVRGTRVEHQHQAESATGGGKEIGNNKALEAVRNEQGTKREIMKGDGKIEDFYALEAKKLDGSTVSQNLKVDRISDTDARNSSR